MENVTVSAVVGGILSLIFEFVPGVKVWWESLTKEQRGFLNGLFVAVSSVGVVFYQCYLASASTCPTDWTQAITNILVPLFIGNQFIYNTVGKPFGKRS